MRFQQLFHQKKIRFWSLADVHIDLRIQRGLIPDETGNRYGYPTLIAALFAYYGIKFTLVEIIKNMKMKINSSIKKTATWAVFLFYYMFFIIF